MTRLCAILMGVTTACNPLQVMRPDQASVAKKAPSSKRDWIQKSGPQGLTYEIDPFDDVEPWQVWTVMGGIALLWGGLIWWLLTDDDPTEPPPHTEPSRRPTYDDMDLDEIFDRKPKRDDGAAFLRGGGVLGPVGR